MKRMIKSELTIRHAFVAVVDAMFTNINHDEVSTITVESKINRNGNRVAVATCKLIIECPIKE